MDCRLVQFQLFSSNENGKIWIKHSLTLETPNLSSEMTLTPKMPRCQEAENLMSRPRRIHWSWISISANGPNRVWLIETLPQLFSERDLSVLEWFNGWTFTNLLLRKWELWSWIAIYSVQCTDDELHMNQTKNPWSGKSIDEYMLLSSGALAQSEECLLCK